MIKKKRYGQVTLYIILGIILLVSSFVTYNLLYKEKTDISSAPIDCIINEGDIKYFKMLMELCLSDATMKSILKIGNNGGYIENLNRARTKNVNGNPVSVGIINTPTSLYGMPYSSMYYVESIANYPWMTYPMSSITLYTTGRQVLPELMDSLSGSPTIRSEMQIDIQNNINPCAEDIKGLFPDHIFDYSDPSVQVALTSDSINVWLYYEITATSNKDLCQDVRLYDQFYTELPFRFKPFYDYIRETANEDTIEFDQDITAYKTTEYPDYSVTVTQDIDGLGFDLIKFTDNNAGTRFEDNKYSFLFVRENRIPAIKPPVNPIDLSSDCSFNVNLNDVFGLATTPNGIDPDEDTISNSFELINPTECSYVTYFDENTGQMSVTCGDMRYPQKTYNCPIRIYVKDQNTGPKDYIESTVTYTCNGCCNAGDCDCSECGSGCFTLIPNPPGPPISVPVSLPSCSPHD
ncbi:hypothetical protein K9M79_02140 [Candidatus Woesearchaeota archaeon]|nr:hypothetical protein [Candidatus Woesearchaeota archaeon]